MGTIIRCELFKKFRIYISSCHDRREPLLAVELQLAQIVGVRGVEQQLRVILKRRITFWKKVLKNRNCKWYIQRKDNYELVLLTLANFIYFLE